MGHIRNPRHHPSLSGLRTPVIVVVVAIALSAIGVWVLTPDTGQDGDDWSDSSWQDGAGMWDPGAQQTDDIDPALRARVEQMWQEHAPPPPTGSASGGSAFSPESPSTYIPPQFREARRRAEEARRAQGYR